MLLVLLSLLPAVGTRLAPEKPCKNDGGGGGGWVCVQKDFSMFVSFSHSRISLQHFCSVHSLPLCPSQLKTIRIAKQFRTSYCYK